MKMVTNLPIRPADWPAPGKPDLRVHDLPHASASTEWWYVNSHFATSSGRSFSLFAAFFRTAVKKHPDGRLEHAHALTWALSDVAKQDYLACSLVDADAPRIGLERMKQKQDTGAKHDHFDRALIEVLKKGRVPRPDRLLPKETVVRTDRLSLDFAGCCFEKIAEGEYRLFVSMDEGPHGRIECEQRLTLKKPPILHGEDGLVRGVHGEDMFYYFVPRCDLRGRLLLDGEQLGVTGQGWYDHEFGSIPPGREEGRQTRSSTDAQVAWTWVSAQLDDDSDVSVYELVHAGSKENTARIAVLSDALGRRYVFHRFTLTASNPWRSQRTFEPYPTCWALEIPEAEIQLDLRATFADQELVTVISKPAFWEGRCEVSGVARGQAVRGLGYVERSGFSSIASVDDFFKGVGAAVCDSVNRTYPLELTRAHAEKLVVAPGREAIMNGVDLAQLARTLIAPVREITDRGGKSWRSYAALACCDVVLGDSRKFADWLALPEFLHVGSLIVDDVQDGSTVRRGGPAAHVKYGEAIAINAGTAAYFMGEQLLRRSLISDACKLKLYDLYFEALREGHAGQALDLDGLTNFVDEVLTTGDSTTLEERVLAIHRLKTGAPAAALARMGAIAGNGSEAQVEALGHYFGAVGLAFQIVDDVLNLRGFKGDLKQKGEDIAHGKVSLPVAKALGTLERQARVALWELIASRPTALQAIEGAIARIESCGALDACMEQAQQLVESAWRELDHRVEDSLAKVMLRAFGWYVLERHY